MFISVIIPVRNEEKHIAEVLDVLIAQNTTTAGAEVPASLNEFEKNKFESFSGFEILVVDGQSTDRTREIVHSYCEKYPNVRYFENPKKLSSAARNIGVQNARGDAVLIVDGHCIIDNENMLANAVKAFEESGADCLARPQPLEMKDATSLQWSIALARRSRLGHNPDSFIYSDKSQFAPASSAAIAYRKSVFDKIGYFDENFDACEDVEFNTRIDKANLKCWFAPSIAVRYVPRKTLFGLFYQMMRYGSGRVKLFRKHRETFSLSMFGLGLFVFIFIAGIVLLPLSYPLLCRHQALAPDIFWRLGLGFYFWCFIVPYVFAVLLESLRLTFSIPHTVGVAVKLPLVFIAIHFGFGWGIVREWVKFYKHSA